MQFPPGRHFSHGRNRIPRFICDRRLHTAVVNSALMCCFFCINFIATVDVVGQQPELKAVHITVAVYQGDGVGKSVKDVLDDLARDSSIAVERITTSQILKDGLKPFDVVLFPGGSGGGQGKSLTADGREKVRQFISDGGGYIGICAGAYLASADYDWSLDILDAKVLDRRHWARGFGNVKLNLKSICRTNLTLADVQSKVYYHQGPLLAPANNSELDDYDEWASFATEVTKEGVPAGVMPGTTAVAAGRFGFGRVLAISPHFEMTDGLDSVVGSAVRWAAASGTDHSDMIVFQQGDLPIVISAPHGGTLKIPGVEPRQGEGLEGGASGFRVVRDGGTEELALEVARQVAKRMNGRPSFVISRVHRRYVDFNRPAGIAVESPETQVVYDQYHTELDAAVRAVKNRHAFGLLIDIHGQGSSAKTLFRGTSNGLTVTGLKTKAGAEFVHGEKSLTGLLKQRGWTVHPDPFEGKEQSGYTGGYIVRTYGSHKPSGIDAIQLELGSGYRKSDVRERVAKELADSIAKYFEHLAAVQIPSQPEEAAP